MKKIIFFLSMVCFFTGLTAFTPPPPAIVTDEHFDFPVDEVDQNPCNHEKIHVTGSVGIDIHTVINGNSANLSIHLQATVDGVGNQGNTYNVLVNQNAHENVSLSGNGQGNTNVVTTLRFISKGSAPNFILRETFHITVNANGDVTVIRDDSSADCRG